MKGIKAGDRTIRKFMGEFRLRNLMAQTEKVQKKWEEGN